MTGIAIGLLVALIGCAAGMPAAARGQTPAETEPDSSLQRVRRLLDERSAPSQFRIATPRRLPTFRVETNAPKPLLRNFSEQMRWALAPRGASFTVGPRRQMGLDVLGTIRAARRYLYRVEVERERREVEAELALIEARWRAEQAVAPTRKQR